MPNIHVFLAVLFLFFFLSVGFSLVAGSGDYSLVAVLLIAMASLAVEQGL